MNMLIIFTAALSSYFCVLEVYGERRVIGDQSVCTMCSASSKNMRQIFCGHIYCPVCINTMKNNNMKCIVPECTKYSEDENIQWNEDAPFIRQENQKVCMICGKIEKLKQIYCGHIYCLTCIKSMKNNNMKCIVPKCKTYSEDEKEQWNDDAPFIQQENRKVCSWCKENYHKQSSTLEGCEHEFCPGCYDYLMSHGMSCPNCLLCSLCNRSEDNPSITLGSCNHKFCPNCYYHIMIEGISCPKCPVCSGCNTTYSNPPLTLEGCKHEFCPRCYNYITSSGMSCPNCKDDNAGSSSQYDEHNYEVEYYNDERPFYKFL